MKYLLLIALLGFSSLVLADTPQDKPFAVIELFSSEGCSSCPSADLLVAKLTAWARQNNESVYPLIFHVDYWNDQGWRDVFSRPEFTQRQRAYSDIFRDQGMYTPQMVVNGSDAFVGSDQAQLQKDLNRELVLPTSVILAIDIHPQETDVLVNYQVQGFTSGDVLNVALVERGLLTEVTAGENAGRTLHHENVVREFLTIPLTGEKGQTKISLHKVRDINKTSIIVFVQSPQTMLITAAKQSDLVND